jgi:glycogen operon protein
LGQGGYLVGKFPLLWSEWNGKYRDAVRKFWKGDDGVTSELAHRLSGSADLYERTGKTPCASINFITSHDGYTLADLVSYQDTHNEANGENNQDGEKNNQSWNCGAEGPTDDPEINKLRRRQQRNFLTTLFLSQGVPMLAGGDEYGRTQKGNNNAYCQDNEISWLNWERDEHAQRLAQFVSKLAALRKEHPVFRRLEFFRGRNVRGTNVHDVKWLNSTGHSITDEEWNSNHRCLTTFFSGYFTDVTGEVVHDASFLICFNAHFEAVSFEVPTAQSQASWEWILDTSDENGFVANRPLTGGKFNMEARSMSVFRLKLPPNAEPSNIMTDLFKSMNGAPS